MFSMGLAEEALRQALAGSGHHRNRPSGRFHEPHRQRTDQPVAGMGGRSDHDGVGADLVSDPAQLGEWVTPDGDEGDGDAELLGNSSARRRISSAVRSSASRRAASTPAAAPFTASPADTGAT